MEKILHTFFSCFEHYKWQSKLGILFCGKALKWHAGLISFKSIDLQHKKATFTNDHLSRNYLLNIFSFNQSESIYKRMNLTIVSSISPTHVEMNTKIEIDFVLSLWSFLIFGQN